MISVDIKEARVPDVLIRGLSVKDLELLDAHARRMGLSRTQYIKQQLHSEARRQASTVTTADLLSLSELLPDLADPDVMRDAWS